MIDLTDDIEGVASPISTKTSYLSFADQTKPNVATLLWISVSTLIF